MLWARETPRLAPLLCLALAFTCSARTLHQAGDSADPSETGKDSQLDPASLQIAAAINEFSQALFDQPDLQPSEEAAGKILSGFSVAQALGMLLNGAEPGSASGEQLAAWLGPELPLDQFNQAFKSLTEAVTAGNSDTGLAISNANSAWLKDSYAWQEDYAATLQAFFNATLDQLTTAQAVNDWVSDATRGKITSIVSDSTVAEAVLMLVNAVYFKGQWVNTFYEGSTSAAPFYLHDAADGYKVKPMQAAMMQRRLDEGKVQYELLEASGNGPQGGNTSVECHALRLPYHGAAFSAVVAMPVGTMQDAGMLTTEDGALAYSAALAACRRAVSARLSGQGQAWAQSEAPINLYLPRFEVEYSASLNAALQALNVTAPFAGGDLTRMAEVEGRPAADLAVSDVVHKAYEKVDEKGTEAAAVTAVIVGVSAPIETNPPMDLRFDRPFVFNIVHDDTGLELFTGEIYRPEQWSGEKAPPADDAGAGGALGGMPGAMPGVSSDAMPGSASTEPGPQPVLELPGSALGPVSATPDSGSSSPGA